MSETSILVPELREFFTNWWPISRRLPGKIAVSDLDAVVMFRAPGWSDIRGWQIFLEAKVGEAMPSVGQEKGFAALADVPRCVTTLVELDSNKRGNPVGYREMDRERRVWGESVPCDLDGFIKHLGQVLTTALDLPTCPTCGEPRDPGKSLPKRW